MSEEIPVVPGLPVIGNLLDLQDENPVFAIDRLCDQYGPIFKFSVLGRQQIVVSSVALTTELADETRFFKLMGGPLSEGKPVGGARGLFTEISEKKEDWGQAHRILMPAFGPLSIENMFDEMFDIASQLVLKWARQGPEHEITAADDFTRLTLDTIALCAMDYRFNSFYSEELHPFVKAMNNTLRYRAQGGQLSSIAQRLFTSANKEFAKDNQYQFDVAKELVEHRRKNPTDKKDLLNAMINGKDPRTGEGMRDALIAANMVTFLIAGHETTSGLLAFAFYYMLTNPSTYQAAKEEVDHVLGKSRLRPEHLKELHYIESILKETLRLQPTAPAFHRGVRPENKEPVVTIGGGKYEIPRNQSILCLLTAIMRDPEVFPEPREFRPERMSEENFAKLPKGAWKPFGTGMRGCIGRPLAWQEAKMVMALVLQNFDIKMADPDYQLKIVQNLTLKPVGFHIKASLRSGTDAVALLHRLQASGSEHSTDKIAPEIVAPGGSGPVLNILFGSNTGTCQTMAQRLAARAAQHGWSPKVNELDTAIKNIPKDQPTIIFTSSYEGQPPDNAAHFVSWLENVEDKSIFKDVKYAVFGCGHRDWTTTFHRIPKLIDDLFSTYGATRIAGLGLSDVSQGEMFNDFENWADEKLWAELDSAPGAPTNGVATSHIAAVDLEVTSEKRESQLQQRVEWAKVTAVKSLSQGEKEEKRHIEFELPKGTSYTAGDYLTVLPLNPEESARRVLHRFDLPWDAVIKINKSGSTTLPINKPILITDLLRGYVELSQPVNRKDIKLLASKAEDPEEKKKLEYLCGAEAFKAEVAERRVTILDLLERHPSIKLPFPEFLALLPPLGTRYYSISSSPLVNPSRCTVTYNVIDEPSWYSPDSHFVGVAGDYLRRLQVGDRALVAVRSTNKYFRLPEKPESTPIVMIGAGTGLAPFRGFIQERAAQISKGQKLAPALLFMGCHTSDTDRLYAEEMDEWMKMGAVDLRYAFSRDTEACGGCKYVQDRLLKDKKDVLKMWDQGAKFYVCGSRAVAKGCGDVSVALAKQRAQEDGRTDVTEEEVLEWKRAMKNERFVMDVFD